MAAKLLQVDEQHLLLIPSLQPVPSQVLVCIAAGEPGKADVRFAGRLVRHLGAEITVLAVLPQGSDQGRLAPARNASWQLRFTRWKCSASARTLIRTVSTRAGRLAEMLAGDCDLLVRSATLRHGCVPEPWRTWSVRSCTVLRILRIMRGVYTTVGYRAHA